MPHSFKRVLEEVIREKAPGPSQSFSIFHLLLALELLAERTTGRNKLAENLGVGAGAVRTIIGRLRRANLVKVSRAGCSLTEKGSRLWRDYESVLKKVEIPPSQLALSRYNFAVLVRHCGGRVRSGIEQRDAAVMAGARSATTMKVQNGRLIIPSVSDNVAGDFPDAASHLTRLLHPENDDAIVIVGSDTSEKAEYGALAAAWALLDEH
jgi:DNA-binding MarR family transcriptional regulator